MVRTPASSLGPLDHLKTALKIAAAVGDGAVNVPGLRSAAITVVEIIDIAQAVTQNKEDAIDVAKSAAERTSSLLDAFKGKFKDDIPLDLQQDVARYAEKLELVQRILRNHTTQTGIWRRVVARFSNRNDINKCKDILNESFQVIELSLTLKFHTRFPSLLDQLQSGITAQTDPVPPKISIIRREELDLRGYWRLDSNTSIVSAEYNGKSVVVRKYGSDKRRWTADLDAWLESDAWQEIHFDSIGRLLFILSIHSRQPHYLQIIGQSEENACSLHLVFRDPGVPVQSYIECGCRENVKKCTLDVLTMVIQFASAANGLLHKDRGGCKIDTADVCLRSTNSAMSGVNFVLADFDPSHMYEPTATDPTIANEGQAITGNLSRPNYVLGHHGETGPVATRLFRFLIHFLVDFPYEEDLKSLQNDVGLLDSKDGSNLLLDSMQRYSSSLCAIWDLWHILPVTPGDLGVMIPGNDARRPVFQKIMNLATKINELSAAEGQKLPVMTSPEYAEQQYFPSDGEPSYWTSEAVDASTIRHSLRLGDIPIATPSGVEYSRGRKISLLGNSFNYYAAWNYLRHLHKTGELLALATERKIHPADLILIFSTSEHRGYTQFMLNTSERRDDLLSQVGAKNGVLHYFENLAAGEGELNGYWSASEKPGDPLWGASPRAPGTEWAWEYSDTDFKVEIGR
ncbi:hypothetical protein B0H13DRAFT_2342656 [Mycena leptocephala]|nr:hypothetical protein B0H13DRAFT_2342656 [Mycena leptocephala]